jgi:hypothetical protein
VIPLTSLATSSGIVEHKKNRQPIIRGERLRFLWNVLFPASLFLFLAVWPWIFWIFLFLAHVFLLRVLRINHMDSVTAKGKVFSGSFEMFWTDIDLGLCIGPLERCSDQLHQVVHEHSPTFLRVE